MDSVSKLELCTRGGGQSQDSARQAGGRPTARHADRHVCAGGVGQPETAARPATASNAHRTCAHGTVRAGVDKRGCGTCPLIARHVPELF